MPRCIDCNSAVITGKVICKDCLKGFEQYSKLRTNKVNVKRMIEILESYGAERSAEGTLSILIDKDRIKRDLPELSLDDILSVVFRLTEEENNHKKLINIKIK